ncbi:MAG: hypothetical protein H6Q02_1888 [Acidobacteria bacterium]|nr:hypothetical protein [Acidobacteriota bacterium]
MAGARRSTPPGEHRVALRYRDPALAVGLPLSLFAAVAAAAVLVVAALRRDAA